MSGKTFDPGAEFEKLARQYWSAWSEFAPKLGAGATGAMPGYQDALSWWTQLASRHAGEGLDAVLERSNAQAGQWFGAMQDLASQFVGKSASAGDITQAWRELLGASGGNPVADMFQRMSGQDAHGFEHWMAQVAPMLGSLRSEAGAFLKLPAFGLAREHQERLQRLAQAQVAYQETSNSYAGLLAQVGKLAFERFESKLGERSEPGRQIESARALFDLWIDAAEEAWAEVAMGAEYRRIYGELANAQMRLRLAIQQEVEIAASLVGMPTRSEINASHRKLAALEREVRQLKSQLGQTRAAPASEPAKPTKTAKPRAASKPKAKPTQEAAPKRAASTRQSVAGARSSPRKLVMPQVAAPRAASQAAPRSRSAAKHKAR